jgi:hypothetical protein
MSSILGVGLASPLGLGRELSIQSWLSETSGLRTNSRWSTQGFPRTDAGLVEGFIPRKQLPDRKAVKLMSRESQLAVFAAVEASQQRNHEDLGPAVAPNRMGAFAAAGYEVSSLADSESMLAAARDPSAPNRILLSRLFTEGRDAYNPLSPLKILPNMPLFHAGLALGIQGPHLSLGSSPAAGLVALGEASESIAGGDCDLALVLGSDAQVEEFRAQLLVEAGVLPLLAPSEGAAALLLGGDTHSPRVLAWDTAQEPIESLSKDQVGGYGRCVDGGKTRRDLYSRVLAKSGDVDLCFSDLWGSEERDRAELFALADQASIKGPPKSNRSRLGWLGAAQGLTDVVIACELLRMGRSKRALVTASGLAGDITAVVLEAPE